MTKFVMASMSIPCLLLADTFNGISDQWHIPLENTYQDVVTWNVIDSSGNTGTVYYNAETGENNFDEFASTMRQSLSTLFVNMASMGETVTKNTIRLNTVDQELHNLSVSLDAALTAVWTKLNTLEIMAEDGSKTTLTANPTVTDQTKTVYTGDVAPYRPDGKALAHDNDLKATIRGFVGASAGSVPSKVGDHIEWNWLSHAADNKTTYFVADNAKPFGGYFAFYNWNTPSQSGCDRSLAEMLTGAKDGSSHKAMTKKDAYLHYTTVGLLVGTPRAYYRTNENATEGEWHDPLDDIEAKDSSITVEKDTSTGKLKLSASGSGAVDNLSIEYAASSGGGSNLSIKGWSDVAPYELKTIFTGTEISDVNLLARQGDETVFVAIDDKMSVPDESTIKTIPSSHTFKVADGKYAEKVKVNGVEHTVNQQGLVDLGQLMQTAAGVPADEVSLSVNASGSTTNLSIKGWSEGTACGEKLTELITGNGSADTSHRLLSWYSGALHYLPLGERLAFPDDVTIEKNTEGKLAIKNGARVAKIKVNGADQTPSADADNRVDLGKVAKSISIGGGDAIDPDENGKITLPISQGTVTFSGTDGLSATGTNVVFAADSSTALTVTATESGGTVTLTFGLRYK